MKSGLSALISPLEVSEFFNHLKNSTPFIIRPDSKKIQTALNLPMLSSLNSMLENWDRPVDVHLPDLRDEASTLTTSGDEAVKLFEQGMGLLFNEVHEISPFLTEWLHEIRTDLGISQMTIMRNLVYATPDGQGTAVHFDQNINFVLQVRGTKIWRVYPNTDVKNPLTRHTLGQIPDPELMSYLEAPLPVRMERKPEIFELTPGTLLFVPRGAWHETEASGDALALNFTFSAPSWMDLITAVLRIRLSQSPRWRDTAYGLSDEKDRDASEVTLDNLLSGLLLDLSQLGAEEILKTTDPLSYDTMRDNDNNYP